MDTILIRDLTLRCIIGINPGERRLKQEVVLNIALECDLAAAGLSDRLADTVDYARLKNRIAAAIGRSRYFLIERMATRVAAICLGDARVAAVTVTVDKPGALTQARSVAVQIRRERADRRDL